jgi:preprotein translocase subunit SecF
VDIVGKRKVWFTISAVILGIGILAMLILGGLNLGIDFTGGTLMQLRFQGDVTVSDVQGILSGQELEELDLGKTVVQRSGDEMLIRTRELSDEDMEKVLWVLQEKLGNVDNKGVKRIGPVVGRETFKSAALGLLLASLFMLIYIYIRFEFLFAVAALSALLHDALAVLGIFALMRFEVNSPFIAAILTIIGYSINDTIVIYDKIRENMKYRKKETVEQVVNKSIKQSLRRSVNTSITTLLVVIALLIFGDPVIREFSLALFFGIIVGTYSSIFIASPLWLTLKTRQATK